LENLEIRFIRFSDWDVKRNITDVLRALEFVISEIGKERRLVQARRDIPLTPFKGGIRRDDLQRGNQER